MKANRVRIPLGVSTRKLNEDTLGHFEKQTEPLGQAKCVRGVKYSPGRKSNVHYMVRYTPQRKSVINCMRIVFPQPPPELRERGAQNEAHRLPQKLSRQREQATGTGEMRERGAQNEAHRIPREAFTAAGTSHRDRRNA